MKEKQLGVAFWSIVAVSAIGMGVVVAFVAGFFLGHFTGHTKTTTVAASGVTPGESGETASAEEESAGGSGEEAGTGVDWSVGGYDLANTRNAKESTIDSSNVSTLGEKWSFPLTAKGIYGSYTTTPLVVGDVVYFQDTLSNVYAVDNETGKLIWERKFNSLNQGPNGVTYSEGKLYGATTPEAFSLDAKTGKVLWKRDLTKRPSEGIDMQPTVANGAVIVSTVPVRGNKPYGPGTAGIVYSLDAETGKTNWTFNTVQSKNLWGRPDVNSGGGLWYPPAVNSKGQVFIGVSNPSPLLLFGAEKYPNGSSHPGNNLYTDSVVALDGKTGKLLWYHQVTPHDFRDYDCQIAPVLANVSVHGTPTEVVIGGCKSGFVVGLEAATGKLLWQRSVGIHTKWSKGPLPPHKFVEMCPGEGGGVETPMAYAEGVIFVPSMNNCALVNAREAKSEPPNEPSGDLTAIEVSTGKVLWHKRLPSLVDGAATIANDVVFTATINGEVFAFNREDGTQLWKTQAPAGINGFPAVSGDSLYVGAGSGGKPALIRYALGAGSSEASMGEEEGEKAPTEEGKGKESSEGKATPPPAEEKNAAAAGAEVFSTNCATCHTLAAAKSTGTVGPNLDELMPDEATVEHQVINGGGPMPAFGKTGVLTPEEIKAVSKYVATEAGKK